MEYGVLGKLEVRRDGDEIDLGAFRQRALLALLLTAPNTVFSTDRILDELWGEDAGTDKHSSLWVYVSGLRTALQPDREKRSEGTILLTRAPGYLIEADPDEIDAVRFERLLTEGRALTDTDPAAASLVLGEALALWRGKAFEDFTYESFAQAEIARLEGLRLEAVEARVDADLLRGMSRELVSELESLVREHPLQERMTGQLMLALYRSGRQADALRSYQLLRSRLGEELGVEPSTQLRRLEEQIVTGDEALEPTARTTLSGPQPGLSVRGYELRDRLGERGSGVLYRAFQPSVGREVAIKVIRPELANDPTFIRRFEAEAQVVARLEHPHIVPLYDYWREPDAAYLVMRLVKGGTLSETLERRALTPEQTIRLVGQIGDALQAAHRAGVVHRELSPAYVLVDDGNAYLSDFGIASGDAARDESPALLACAAPEQIARGDVGPATDLYRLAVVTAQALTGLTGEIAQIRGALAPPVVQVIDRATDPDPGRRHADVAAFVAEIQQALGTADVDAGPPVVDVVNPYKGLRAFEGADAGDFFGRERLVERLLARLGEPNARSRFVSVVGPSGSGKSSIVKAGLLPAIRRRALAGTWFTVTMTPAPHPFEALEEALLGVAIDPPTTLLEQLARDERGLQRAVRDVLPEDGSRLLLVIDQFEELFTQVDPDTAERFITTMVSAVSDEHGRVTVVATLRADFYDRPLRHRGLGELLRDGTEIITPMTPDELERAITGPVEPHGITFEPALVAELVRDVVDRAGALPLLQYALTELFDARQGNRITHATYHDLGGVSGALVSRAEGLFAGLGDAACDVTRQVFLRLVTLGEGTDDTRRRVLRGELEQLAVERRSLDGVLDTFGRHRLLSFDRDPVTRGPTVEISHESLLTEWNRLRDWIDGARDDVRNQRRLAEAMAEWIAAGRADDYLLRGGRLDQLHGWTVTTTLPLSAPERAFLDTSVAARDRAAEEERAREQRAAVAERRAHRRVLQLAALGVVAAVIAALAVYGFAQQRAASDAKDDVDRLLTAVTLASSSQAALTDDPELALLLAVEAMHATSELGFATEDAVDSVHWALQEMRVPYDVDADTPVAVRVRPRGPAGVYVIPPAQLVDAAMAATQRRLTDDECERHLSGSCPVHRDLPSDLPIFGGIEAYAAAADADRPLAGTTVKLFGGWDVEPGLEVELAAFEERTGIDVEYSPSDERAWALISEGRSLPDIHSIPQPGALAGLAGDGLLLDLTDWIDTAELRADVGDYLTSLSTVAADGSWPAVEGSLYGVPIDVDLKGLVYYPKAAFDAAGYEVPTTYDELVTLSHRITDDGNVPWCVGFESGTGSGWPGTDFVESMVIRVGGVDVYDQWVDHRVPFDHPAAAEAARLLDSLLFEPDFVRLGPSAISNQFFHDQLFHMLRRDPRSGEPDPQCFLHHGGDFMLGMRPADASVGVDLDFFVLPPVDPREPNPATGGGNFVGAYRDRPEVRAIVEFMATPEWGRSWAAFPGSNGFLSPNARFDLSHYRAGLEPERDAVRLALGTEVRSAIGSGIFRFDGSDLMPGEIGAFGDGEPGAFWSGMLDWVDGVRSIDQVMADIEAAWVEFEAIDSS